MSNLPLFRTSISEETADGVWLRGYPLNDLMGNASFAATVYLLLQGELPTPQQERMLEAIIVSCTDHGVRPPSIRAARTVASGGAQFQAAVAGGILSLGDSHGGAIDLAMKVFQDGIRGQVSGASSSETARAVIEAFRQAGKRLPGFGHPSHAVDPRTVRLMDLAKKWGIYGPHADLAESMVPELCRANGRNLPLNVDGAVAALLSDMGFDWRVGKGFFIMGRAAGIVAHVFEEFMREKPMAHRPSDEMLAYDGVARRELPPDRRRV